jgi:hypothetical protein
MSCDWSVYCKTCNETHDFTDANHQKDLMLVLITHARAIAGLSPLMQDNRTFADISLTTSYGTIDVEWFRRHLEHELVPRDEYGNIAAEGIGQ